MRRSLRIGALAFARRRSPARARPKFTDLTENCGLHPQHVRIPSAVPTARVTSLQWRSRTNMQRRVFLQSALAGTALRAADKFDLAAIERPRVLKAAAGYLTAPPVTVTAASSPRSAGGPHDFFSEGDYWWPDPANPGGPYVQRDGMTNPY